MQNQLSAVLERKGNKIHFAAPNTSVSDAVRKMHEHKVGSLLVMEQDQLRGIITERDVLFRVVNDGIDATQTPVSKVMTDHPKTVSPTTTVEDAMRQVTDERVRHLPLINGDKVVGVISSGDLTRWVVDAQQGEIKELHGAVKKEGNKFKATIALVAAFAILILIGIVTS